MYLLTYDPVDCTEENRKNVEGLVQYIKVWYH